ncbi:LOW QUALITY PROTEIN: hypothetical protein Cgig2_001897 [Carnegiea gigantea]|uniref:Uncharacterized protein n=1 Tax=Carnegiea gigantea TaxID=171969 RepID=A0A9Q1GT02_9CARY|nr:LOW QUALITY PROTEIN: hypothetical protein Cgig2_001897 [Carnegiea gigantea]
MSSTRRSLFVTSVQILFERYASTDAPKQTLCIPQKANKRCWLHSSLEFLSRIEYEKKPSILSFFRHPRCQYSVALVRVNHLTLTEHVSSSVLVGFSRQFGFHQDILANIDFSILMSSKIMLRLHQAYVCYRTNYRVLFRSQCPSLERKFTLYLQEWWSKVPILEGTQRGRETIHLTKIFNRKKPLRPPVLDTEDNIPQTKIPGVGIAISVTPISAILIQSVAMTAKGLNEVSLTPKPSPTIACRLKAKIYYCLYVKCSKKLNYRKVIFPPPDGAENIMDIWITHCFSSIEHLSSLGQDFLGNDLCLNDSKSICTLNDDDEAESTPRQILYECPFHHALQEFHKMLLSLATKLKGYSSRHATSKISKSAGSTEIRSITNSTRLPISWMHKTLITMGSRLSWGKWNRGTRNS